MSEALVEGTIEAGHLGAALDALKAGVVTFDRELQIRFFNQPLLKLLGVAPDVMQRVTMLPRLLDASRVLDSAAIDQLCESCIAAVASPRGQSALVELRGAARQFDVRVTPMSDGHWIASFEDATARMAAAASAVELAMRDPLTGLPNRKLFTEHLAAALAGAALMDPAEPGAAVMLIDLDRFKGVNDTLGHPVGDALLRLVGKRLRAMLRKSDVAARIGGDEFAVLVAPGLSHAALGQLALRIVDVLGRPYLVEGHLVNIGASIGLSCAPADGHDGDHLLRSADLALYEAKNNGRHTFRWFRPELDAKALARRTLEIDLRKAMALGQFELHYQPQVDLVQQRVVGFEALLRWRHPERGLVPPAQFISLAEDIGLIVPIGEWVMREACRQAVQWPDDISVAVNVSPHQFEDAPRLVRVIGDVLAATGLSGHRLEIEITETVLLRCAQEVLAALHAVRRLQVRVAMDDFGTGYSSLSQLHSFPFDKIKIDRSFVTDQGDLEGQNAVIRAITTLGASLGMATIVEGVETVAELARVRAQGCSSVQGYLFSAPVTPGEAKQLIARQVSETCGFAPLAFDQAE